MSIQSVKTESAVWNKTTVTGSSSCEYWACDNCGYPFDPYDNALERDEYRYIACGSKCATQFDHIHVNIFSTED